MEGQDSEKKARKEAESDLGKLRELHKNCGIELKTANNEIESLKVEIKKKQSNISRLREEAEKAEKQRKDANTEQSMDVDPALIPSASQPTIPPKPATEEPSVEAEMNDAPPIAPSNTPSASSNANTSASSNAPPTGNPLGPQYVTSTPGSNAVLEAPVAGVLPTKQQVRAFVLAKGNRVSTYAMAAHSKIAIEGQGTAWRDLLIDTVVKKDGFFSLKK